jgi:hypothetical protein
MPEIYEQNGTLIATLPLSQFQIRQLDSDMSIIVRYHMPRQANKGRGEAGSFILRKADGKIVATDAEAVRRCVAMLQTAGSIDDKGNIAIR